MILNGSVGLFHATVTVAIKSIRVWACATAVSGSSAKSANTSLFMPPPRSRLLLFALRRLDVDARPNLTTPDLTTMRLNKFSPAALGSRTGHERREHRVALR